MSSPYINRFLQPDTLIPDPSNPQSWNRFSYVLNNPVRFNDPTGHYCVGDDEDCVDGGGGTGPTCYPGELVCQLRKEPNKSDEKKHKPVTEVVKEMADDALSSLASLAGNKYTSLALATAQEVSAGVQDVGLILEGSGFVSADVPLAALGGSIYLAGYGVGRVAGTLGLGVTFYQYAKNLNGTNRTDVYESVLTTVAAYWMPLSDKASTINFLYNGARLGGWDVPELPGLFP